MNWLTRIFSRAEPPSSTTGWITIHLTQVEIDALQALITRDLPTLVELEHHPKLSVLREGLEQLGLVLSAASPNRPVTASRSAWVATMHLLALTVSTSPATELPQSLGTVGKKIWDRIPASARTEISDWLAEVAAVWTGAHPTPAVDWVTVELTKAEIDALQAKVDQDVVWIAAHPQQQAVRAGLQRIGAALAQSTAGGSQHAAAHAEVWPVVAPLSAWTATAQMVGLASYIDRALDEAHRERTRQPSELWSAGKKIMDAIPPSAHEEVGAWLADIFASLSADQR
jgi:hypothetical protein